MHNTGNVQGVGSISFRHVAFGCGSKLLVWRTSGISRSTIHQTLFYTTLGNTGDTPVGSTVKAALIFPQRDFDVEWLQCVAILPPIQVTDALLPNAPETFHATLALFDTTLGRTRTSFGYDTTELIPSFLLNVLMVGCFHCVMLLAPKTSMTLLRKYQKFRLNKVSEARLNGFPPSSDYSLACPEHYHYARTWLGHQPNDCELCPR